MAKANVRKDEPQLLNELQATGAKFGLLINFGRTKVELKRMVFSPRNAHEFLLNYPCFIRVNPWPKSHTT